MIFADPGNELDPPEEVLRAAFGLTPAQARLASALLTGKTLTSYAESAGISINTAKTQMRQIFQKTGQSRQADLIRVIAANPTIKLARR
jgi:DNA-binding CsgD family transcriptional regulator